MSPAPDGDLTRHWLDGAPRRVRERDRTEAQHRNFRERPSAGVDGIFGIAPSLPVASWAKRNDGVPSPRPGEGAIDVELGAAAVASDNSSPNEYQNCSPPSADSAR